MFVQIFEPAEIDRGMQLIVSNSLEDWSLLEQREMHVPLHVHPFGLDLPRHSFDSEHTSWASPDLLPDEVVKVIARKLNWAICASFSEAPVRCLRIFNLQQCEEEREKHHCYYELCTLDNLFFCGYGTDYGTQGRHANRCVRAMFSLMQHLYLVPVEEYEVPYEAARSFDPETVNMPIYG